MKSLYYIDVLPLTEVIINIEKSGCQTFQHPLGRILESPHTLRRDPDSKTALTRLKNARKRNQELLGLSVLSLSCSSCNSCTGTLDFANHKLLRRSYLAVCY